MAGEHNTTVLSLIQNTDTEQQPTCTYSTNSVFVCVCDTERDGASERRIDRKPHGGLKTEDGGGE